MSLMSRASTEKLQEEAHHLAVHALLAELGVDAHRGLSQEEAQARLTRDGKNELTVEQAPPAWKKVLAQYQDPLVILLLVATVMSFGMWLYERESAWPYEAIAILAVVLLNGIMGYLQQSRAEQAVAALRRMSAAQAHVLRDAARHSIPAT